MFIDTWMVGLAKAQIVLCMYIVVVGEKWRIINGIKRADYCVLQLNHLGKRLLERRLEFGWEPVKVATLTGVTLKTVLDTEKGVRIPHNSKLKRYAKALLLDPEELEYLAEISKKPAIFHRTGL